MWEDLDQAQSVYQLQFSITILSYSLITCVLVYVSCMCVCIHMVCPYDNNYYAVKLIFKTSVSTIATATVVIKCHNILCEEQVCTSVR